MIRFQQSTQNEQEQQELIKHCNVTHKVYRENYMLRTMSNIKIVFLKTLSLISDIIIFFYRISY